MRIEQPKCDYRSVFYVYYTEDEYFTVSAETEEQARDEIEERLNEMIFGLKNLMLENEYQINQL